MSASVDTTAYNGAEINDYLKSKGLSVTEGYSAEEPKEIADLVRIARDPSIKHIMDIGFNGGHSSYMFLKSNPAARVVSFDIGDHDYVKYAKEAIDSLFPGRHTLIIGDSVKTVPEFTAKNPDVKFDFIFIDGNHEGDHPRLDFTNCRALAHKDTIIAIDDTVYVREWIAHHTRAPTATWENAVKSGGVVEIGRDSYGYGRGLSWGKYVL